MLGKRSHRGYAHQNPQRPDCQARHRDDARFQHEEGHRRHPACTRATSRALIISTTACRARIKIVLKYAQGKESVIKGLKRISKPGLRVYAKNDEIPRVLGGLGVAIVSTSKGVMSDRSARAAGIGGEVLAYVW